MNLSCQSATCTANTVLAWVYTHPEAIHAMENESIHGGTKPRQEHLLFKAQGLGRDEFKITSAGAVDR
eukprot:11415766-Karenia_brevis.AAC.1